MRKFLKKIRNHNAGLSLDKQISNEVLLILALLSVITGIQNLVVDLPWWFSLMFFVASIFALSMFIFNYFRNAYRITKFLSVVVMYAMTIVSWTFNGGIDGATLLFIIALLIYSIGFYPKRFVLNVTLNFAVFAALVLLNYYYPDTLRFNYLTGADRVVDMISSYLIIILSIVLVLSIILNNYERSSKTVENQKYQLEALNGELNLLNTELRNQNMSKDRLISVISHDLRGPMSTLLGLSEAMSKKHEDMDKSTLVENILIINRTHERILNMLEDLLLWAKSQANKLSFNPMLTDLFSVCNEIVMEQEISAKGKDIDLRNTVEQGQMVVADRNMLMIIIRNLTSNALKFTGRGGMVCLSSTKADGQVVISVSDTGTGIKEECIDKIWDPEKACSSAGTEGERGTGLGLVLCKEFVEKHKGTIWVESKPGQGSCFSFTMPVEKSHAHADLASPGSQMLSSGSAGADLASPSSQMLSSGSAGADL